MKIEDLELTFASLAAAHYEGWVAWIDDGGPEWRMVLEERTPNHKLIQSGGKAQNEDNVVRKEGRNVMPWRNLPHDKVQLVAVFGFYGQSDQPVTVIQRNSPEVEMRFFQFKRRGLLVHAGGVVGGQQRTGISGRALGYWNRTHGFCELVDARLFNGKLKVERTMASHPCWPKPHGFGLNPTAVGLTEAPECPHVPLPLEAANITTL